MTDEELNIAICIARGWKHEPVRNGEPCVYPWRCPNGCYVPYAPDHINGIAALGHMHEAEKRLLDFNLAPIYDKTLNEICDLSGWWGTRATARQRAVALARTLNIYKETT